jgi:hypothetical protein
VVQLVIVCSWPQGPSYFWLDPKVTKRSSQQRGFFTHEAYAANQAKPGLEKFAPLSLAHDRYFCKNFLCPATLWPPSFYLISAEAFLLTGKRRISEVLTPDSLLLTLFTSS